MARCMFRMVKGKGYRYRSKGKKCTPAASTVKRHIKKHGCHGRGCISHIAAAREGRGGRYSNRYHTKKLFKALPGM